MRSPLGICLLLLLFPGLTTADDKALKEARQRWLQGDYAEAQERYEKLVGDKLKVEATLGVSRCLQSQGEYDKALEVVEKLLKDKPRDARLLARQAELLYLRGRWALAEKAANAAAEIDKEPFLARWILGQIY